ncbi:hypothetical protein B0G57_101361 [Trinickia symbiotica]|nr:hypothetical protein B0G57_101361 [Trinickia symbiotica]
MGACTPRQRTVPRVAKSQTFGTDRSRRLAVRRCARRCPAPGVQRREGGAKETLRQQRGDAVLIDGHECAGRNDVVAPHAATGQDGGDGRTPAKFRRAAAAVGCGAIAAKIPRWLSAVPSNQRTSGSHDDLDKGNVFRAYTSSKKVVKCVVRENVAKCLLKLLQTPRGPTCRGKKCAIKFGSQDETTHLA